MENISMIAAVGKNLELGRGNDLIWHFKEDMKFFREQTMGKPIVMGYNTLISLPKLLPGRLHIVLSSKNLNLGDGVVVVHSMDELLEEVMKYPEVMVIGGASIYKQMIDYSDKMYLTEIDDEAFADVYFPSFNKNEWDCSLISEHIDNDIKFNHVLYKRKGS